MTGDGGAAVAAVPAVPSVFWAEHLWTGEGAVRHGVVVEVVGDRVVSVADDVVAPPAGSTLLWGLTLPGLVNAHSHAFHRALRGRTQVGSGSFWTWREVMYSAAARLTPENYEALATAAFTEMVLAGITTVGEFHYVHHTPDGTPHDDPIAMSRALVRAAATAGVRLTLLDTCYLVGGFAPDAARESGPDVEAGPDVEQVHVPLSAAQLRFGDGTAADWARRASATRDELSGPTVVVGAAVHSVRAVPERALGTVASWAHAHDVPLHVHVSEQPAENADCVRLLGSTPVALLRRHGVLDHRATAVHATHLTPGDVADLAAGGTWACFCVTTERDLADGIGPAAELVEAGVQLTVGSDSHAVIDILEEVRGIESGQRLVSGRRGWLGAAQLLAAATVQGARSLGWDDGGTIAPGALADFTTVSLDSVRLADARADSLLESVVFSATASDVTWVVVGGEVVVRDGEHARVSSPGSALRDAIAAVLPPESSSVPSPSPSPAPSPRARAPREDPPA
ncbi:formimidoylglutamate deiminase [Frigoribacterium sp. PvP032]|uniref:formimidoylglutamate deiminase n=1 Tax=Frigoribacterium sp. PvP032 TaxID=2806589 RepID=UPI001AE4C61C|nr:formimidoylglutamate deiminase [Frigoribacterium sp. PvP032]MBP1190483.1 cytosine/adenosine deaminase-related metal-dependent hydrolase [Frigoribacterium sp. PvP032]